VNGFKLKEGISRLHLRRKFFTEREVRCWKRMRRLVRAAPCWGVFKARWDGALGNLL